jgi:hypothetical protein
MAGSTSTLPAPQNIARNTQNGGIPQTYAITSHVITMLASDGSVIGMVNGWTPAQTRAIAPIFELNVATSGVPIENIPGNLGGLTLTVSRYDIYTDRMEQAFGTPDMDVLTDQTTPFFVYEQWSNQDGTIYKAYAYTGCWFSNLGRAFRSDDNRVILVNATINYINRVSIVG